MILAPAMVFPELVPFILIEKGVKVNLFLLFFKKSLTHDWFFKHSFVIIVLERKNGDIMELEKLDKIGPKTAKTLNNLGIYNAEDLIRNYPYRF